MNAGDVGEGDVGDGAGLAVKVQVDCKGFSAQGATIISSQIIL